MLPIERRLSCLCLVAMLAACSRGTDPDADVLGSGKTPPATGAPASAAPPPAKAPEVVMPVEVSNDAITLGTATNGNRVVKATRTSFTLSDTVYAGIAGGRPPGTEAKVYWTYQDGLSHKEETRALASDGAVFAFDRASGLKAGRYNVQVDVSGTPIGIVEFEVR